MRESRLIEAFSQQQLFSLSNSLGDNPRYVVFDGCENVRGIDGQAFTFSANVAQLLLLKPEGFVED